MPAAAKVFYGAAAILLAVALVFFADALGAPVYRRLGAAWAWLNCALFVGLGLGALFLAHLSEELARIEARLARIEARLGRDAARGGPAPGLEQSRKGTSGISP